MPWTAFVPPSGKGRTRPLGITPLRWGAREYRAGSEAPSVCYEFRSTVMPRYCFAVANMADLCGCGGILRHGLCHPRFAALLRGELPEWETSFMRRGGAAFPPGILVRVGDPNTVQLGWPGIPADGEVLVVLHFRGLPSTVAVTEYHGDGMYPGFLLGGVLAKSTGAGGGVEDLCVLPPSFIAGLAVFPPETRGLPEFVWRSRF